VIQCTLESLKNDRNNAVVGRGLLGRSLKRNSKAGELLLVGDCG